MFNVRVFKVGPRKSDRFDIVMRPLFEVLYAATRRMTLSPHDAEDLLQEA